MYSRISPRHLIIALSATQIVGTILGFVYTRDYLLLALLIAPVINFRLKERIFLISMGHSIALTMMLDHAARIYILLLSAYSVLLGVLAQYLITEDTEFIASVMMPVLLLAPVYIIAPFTLIYPLTSMITLLIVALKAYITLSKTKVEILQTKFLAKVGEVIEIPVKIACPSKFSYTIHIDEVQYTRGTSDDIAESLVKIPVTVLGFQRRVLSVSIRDLRGLARIEPAPVTIEITALPRLAEVLRKVEDIVKRYATYLGVPIILKGSIRIANVGLQSYSIETGLHGSSLGSLLETSSEHQGGTASFSSEYFHIHGDTGGIGHKQIAHDSDLEAYALTKGSITRRARDDILQARSRIEWRRPLRVIERVAEKAKSHVGEYLGVREYQPGDNPRAIHWKKSLKTSDRDDIVVKVYGSESIDRGPGGGDFVIFADLVTPSPRELDLILHAVYSILLEALKSPKDLGVNAYVYLVLPRGTVYFLNGKVLDVISALDTILMEDEVRAMYDYDPYPRNRILEVASTGFLKSLQEYYTSLGTLLIRELIDRKIPKQTTIYMLFSRALIYKYSVISAVLEKAGYRVSLPKIS